MCVSYGVCVRERRVRVLPYVSVHTRVRACVCEREREREGYVSVHTRVCVCPWKLYPCPSRVTACRCSASQVGLSARGRPESGIGVAGQGVEGEPDVLRTARVRLQHGGRADVQRVTFAACPRPPRHALVVTGSRVPGGKNQRSSSMGSGFANGQISGRLPWGLGLLMVKSAIVFHWGLGFLMVKSVVVFHGVWVC